MYVYELYVGVNISSQVKKIRENGLPVQRLTVLARK